MSRVDLFNGVKITVESSGVSYHSYTDWGLYVTNTDYIGEPKQVTNYVQVPGRDGLIDLSEVITGRPIYSGREINIELSGHRNKVNWDSAMSAFRNSINGRMCQITFDNDLAYYWRGRIDVKDFDSVMSRGTFNIHIPDADPYKYNVQASTEPWKWDPFNFLTGEIIETHATTIHTYGYVDVPAGSMPVCPNIVVSKKTGTLILSYHDTYYILRTGDNIFPQVMVNGDSAETLEFTGNGTVQIVYRGGSL